MKKLRILLIDDNNTVLIITETLLKKAKFIHAEDTLNKLSTVEELCNHELASICSNNDIIICDHNLEERITGFDFLKILKNFGFNGLQILLTSDESYELKAKIDKEEMKYVVKNIEEGEHSTNEILGNLIKKYREKAV